MLDAWIIEQLKKQKEKEDAKIQNENVLYLPIPEEIPCKNDDHPLEYTNIVEFDLNEREEN